RWRGGAPATSVYWPSASRSSACSAARRRRGASASRGVMTKSSPARLSDPHDFSLVLGGPLYQLWRRFFLSGPALELLARRMIGIPTIAWLPLLVLSAWEGHLFRGVAGPLLYDFALHPRFRLA